MVKVADDAKAISPRLGAYIKERRNELGLTQVELGKRLGYRYGNFVAMLERGAAIFPVQKWEDYAEALEAPKHEFLKLVVEEMLPSFIDYTDFHESRAEIRRKKRLAGSSSGE